MSFEEKMKKELKKNLEIPDVVEQKIQDAYREIGEKDKTAYGKIADNSESVQNPGSEAENNGVTVTVSDAYCDGYEMYFTITAITDNDQVNQKDYLLPEKSQQVYVNGEKTGAELSLKKALSDWGISVPDGWLTKHLKISPL